MSIFSSIFRKSYDLKRRARAAFEDNAWMCEACGATTPLDALVPLTVHPCPKCGFNGLVPARANDFLLYEPLGAGGVSSVYKAIHRNQPNRLFAVKILRTDREIDEKTLQEFLFEGDVHQAVCPHPFIAALVEQGEQNGLYYHAMEFIPGESVKSRVDHSGRIPEPIALTWLSELVSALRHISEKGFLYRDISPGNLVIRSSNSICLIDFGLVLTLEDADQGGARGEVVGTPEYLTPERVQQIGEDERSSVYSLGLLLFYMLKGEPMIKRETNVGVALQHVSSMRVAFNERMLPSDCSPGVITLLGAMIKYDPIDRIQSLAELAAELDRLSSGS